MPEVTSALVKELREKTGAGMMDCKRALTETAGEMEAAVDWLRKKGLAAAAKKSGRVAAEGLIAVSAAGASAAMIEMNAETDFVARNEAFQHAAAKVASIALGGDGTLDTLNAAAMGNGRTVAEEVTHLVATIGEHMSLRRVCRLVVETGVVSSYVHAALAPGLGKIGVLVALDSKADPTALAGFGHQLAMHIAAARPEAVNVADLDPAKLERERDVLTEQARASGRPEAIIAKMVEGRLRKYHEEVVLLEQTWVIDGESKVTDVVERTQKTLGQPIRITAFARFQLGEGIDRGANDFAAEVAQLAG